MISVCKISSSDNFLTHFFSSSLLFGSGFFFVKKDLKKTGTKGTFYYDLLTELGLFTILSSYRNGTL